MNISHMAVTLSTAQPPMSWLKAPASQNILAISVTLLVAQPPMSPLKTEPCGTYSTCS